MAGGVISTGNHPKALWPGVAVWFGNSYNDYPAEWKSLVTDIKTSDKNYEEVVQDTGFAIAPAKAQGAGVAFDANVQGYVTRATHVTYALGYAVTMEELQDNLYEQVSMSRSKANAFSQAQTRELVTANVMNKGFSTALQIIGDGAAFFSTSHPLSNGGSFANKPTTDVDLSEASLEDALIAIAGFQNDRGLQIAIMPKQLVVSRQNQFNAARILKSTYQNDTAQNAINAIKAMNILPDGFTVNHYLTDVNAWFVKNEIPTGSGFTFWERMPVTFDKDNDFNTKNALASSITRFSVAVADPRCYYGSSGAS
jgi:phage major head subunit gpT-like protein